MPYCNDEAQIVGPLFPESGFATLFFLACMDFARILMDFAMDFLPFCPLLKGKNGLQKFTVGISE